MIFVSLTRLRIRSWRFMPGFAWQTFGSTRQVRAAAGFLGGFVLPDHQRTFWTMTGWDSEASMRAYLVSGAHKRAMPRLLDWCDEASVAHWEQDDPALPSWAEAATRMRREGRPSKVRHPSPVHASLAFAEPRLSGAAPLHPKRRA